MLPYQRCGFIDGHPEPRPRSRIFSRRGAPAIPPAGSTAGDVQAETGSGSATQGRGERGPDVGGVAAGLHLRGYRADDVSRLLRNVRGASSRRRYGPRMDGARSIRAVVRLDCLLVHVGTGRIRGAAGPDEGFAWHRSGRPPAADPEPQCDVVADL